MAGVSAADFRFYAFRFQFVAADAIVFPPGKAGNIVRGAFGAIFRRLACVPECKDVRTCEIRFRCPYARIFEPSRSVRPAGGGPRPSGLADFPRPFVFRAHHLDGRLLRPGETFHFDVHIFEWNDPALGHFVRAFAELACEGIGPGRGRAALVRVDLLGENGLPEAMVYDGSSLLEGKLRPVELSLEPWRVSAGRVRVRFITPTELKAGQGLAEQPEFPVLFARIRDRISALRALYGPGPLEVDFRGLAGRAAAVKMTRCDVTWVISARRSTRTGRRHPLGGFTGEAEYQGDLAEFLPYLRAACWTGVGRQTVWGKGALEVIALPADTPIL